MRPDTDAQGSGERATAAATAAQAQSAREARDEIGMIPIDDASATRALARMRENERRARGVRRA